MKTVELESKAMAVLSPHELNAKRIYTGPYYVNVDKLRSQISLKTVLRNGGHNVQIINGDYKCRCPFHKEDAQSFTVYDDTYGHCFGCGWHGDVFAYDADYSNTSYNDSVMKWDIWMEEDDVVCRRGPVRADAAKPMPSDSYSILEQEEKKQSARAAHDKYLSEGYSALLVKQGPGWNFDTLQYLANDRSLILNEGTLTFKYKTGARIRTLSDKSLQWAPTRASRSLWRQYRIKDAPWVYITENEYDAMSLINLGTERLPGTVVVSTPGRMAFKEQWGPLFLNKSVGIAFGNDDLGKICRERAVAILKPYVSQYNVIDLM